MVIAPANDDKGAAILDKPVLVVDTFELQQQHVAAPLVGEAECWYGGIGDPKLSSCLLVQFLPKRLINRGERLSGPPVRLEAVSAKEIHRIWKETPIAARPGNDNILITVGREFRIGRRRSGIAASG
jgi:hypothetical protein